MLFAGYFHRFETVQNSILVMDSIFWSTRRTRDSRRTQGGFVIRSKSSRVRKKPPRSCDCLFQGLKNTMDNGSNSELRTPFGALNSGISTTSFVVFAVELVCISGPSRTWWWSDSRLRWEGVIAKSVMMIQKILRDQRRIFGAGFHSALERWI